MDTSIKKAKKTPSIFVGGPITHIFKEGIFDQSLAELLDRVEEVLIKRGYSVNESYSSNNNIHSAYIYEKRGQLQPKCSKEIFDKDIKWIKVSNAAIFILPEESNGDMTRTDGTYIEIGICYANDVPILLISPREINGQFSPMLEGMIDDKNKVFFATNNDFFQEPDIYLRKILTNNTNKSTH